VAPPNVTLAPLSHSEPKKKRKRKKHALSSQLHATFILPQNSAFVDPARQDSKKPTWQPVVQKESQPNEKTFPLLTVPEEIYSRTKGYDQTVTLITEVCLIVKTMCEKAKTTTQGRGWDLRFTVRPQEKPNRGNSRESLPIAANIKCTTTTNTPPPPDYTQT